MKINLSCHHTFITDGIETAVEKKLSKVGNHFPDIETLDVILKIDGRAQCIEVSTHYHGTTHSVSAKDDDLYNAIQSVAKKLESSLSKRKERLKGNRDTIRDSELAE